LEQGLKKILDILGEGIGFFTLDIDCPKDMLHRLVEDGNDNFGAGFRKEGIMRDAIYRDRAYHSLVLMSL
jgi:hypothetical protein